MWMEEYNKGEIGYEELAYNKFMKQHGDRKKWAQLKHDVVNKFRGMKLL